MSTTKKEGGSAKEKMFPSSPSRTTIRKKSSPGSSKTGSTSKSLGSSPSTKSIPNYLKPTISSSGDTTKVQDRKPVSKTETSHKLNLARRRSFDKAPSSTPTPTPKARGVSPTPASRSSSSSGKTTTPSPKGTRDSAGKHHSLYARPAGNANKSSIKGKKGKTQAASSRKEPKLGIPGNEEKEHQDSPAMVDREEVDEAKITEQVVSQVDSPTLPEENDADIAKVEESDGGSISKAESPIVLEQNDAPSASNASNGAGESPTNMEEGDIASEHDDDLETRSCIEEQEVKVDSMNDETNPDEGPAGSKEEADVNESGDDEGGESEVDNDNDEVEVEVEGGEVVEDENTAPNEAHGKKDMELSNNVIEETAEDLKKHNSSRVRALAGAFQTAISMQDPK